MLAGGYGRVESAVESVELLEIPAGWFRMGWEDGLPDARPSHPVWVDRFQIARTPVTNAEFGEFLRSTGAPVPPFWTDPRFSHPEQPVVGVTWAEAVSFCEWLSRERAARTVCPARRSGSGRPGADLEHARYPWGNEPPRPLVRRSARAPCPRRPRGARPPTDSA